MATHDPKSLHRLPLCLHAPLQYLTICYCFPQTHDPVAPHGPPLTTMDPTGPIDPPWICPQADGSHSAHSSSAAPVYPPGPLRFPPPPPTTAHEQPGQAAVFPRGNSLPSSSSELPAFSCCFSDLFSPTFPLTQYMMQSCKKCVRTLTRGVICKYVIIY